MTDLSWSDDQIVQATRLLSGAEVDIAGGLNPAPPAGEQASPAQRREAEATWLWLREALRSVSQSPR